MTPSDNTPSDPAAEPATNADQPLAMDRTTAKRPVWANWHLPVGAIAAIALAAGFGGGLVTASVLGGGMGGPAGYGNLVLQPNDDDFSAEFLLEFNPAQCGIVRGHAKA